MKAAARRGAVRWLPFGPRLVAASVRRRPGQLVLVALAVAVAAATAALLVAFAGRLQAHLAEDLSRFGPNVIVRPQPGSAAGLPEGAEAAVLGVPGVEAAAIVVEASLALPSGPLRLLAAGPELARLHPGWEITGRWPAAGEALLGERLRPAAAAAGSPPGDLDVGPDFRPDLQASGRLATGTALDEAVIVPLDDLALWTGDVRHEAVAERVEVRAATGRAGEVAREIEAVIAGVEARPLMRVSESDARLSRRVALLLAGVSGVTLVLSLLAVGAAAAGLVGERRREIGALLALGLAPRRAGRLLAAELLAVAAFGALMGTVAGELAAADLTGRLLGAGAAGYVPGLALPAALAVALLATGGALVVACRRLTALDPARVLKGE